MIARPVATITEPEQEKHFFTNHSVNEWPLHSTSTFGCCLAVVMCICDKPRLRIVPDSSLQVLHMHIVWLHQLYSSFSALVGCYSAPLACFSFLMTHVTKQQ